MSIVTGQNIDPDDFVGNPAPYLSFSTSTSATVSLTTVANQRVIVWAKARGTGSLGTETMTLAYNGVTKDTAQCGTGASDSPVLLMYSEIPGAATQNITITITGGAGLTEVQIIICKLLVG